MSEGHIYRRVNGAMINALIGHRVCLLGHVTKITNDHLSVRASDSIEVLCKMTNVSVLDTQRRKFYVASYAAVEEGQKVEKEAARRELLKARDKKVDLESNLGKSTIVTKTSDPADLGGYYCKICDCVVKDSINYLDHINGKKHQRNLGMSMKIERSSLDKVRERFKANKRKQEEVEKEYDLKERLVEIKEEEEKIKSLNRERKHKKKSRFDDAPNDDDIAKIMGFGSFGGSKKTN